MRRSRARILPIIAALAAIFAGAITMFDFQDELIFPIRAVPKAGPVPQGAELLTLNTADGDTLSGIYIPADEPRQERLLIIGFGGNAWNGQDVAEYLHDLYPEAEVVAFHYRGYAPSTGSPSAEALLSDAPLIYDMAVQRVKPGRTVAVGFSIGSGIAGVLAHERPLAGAILVTPFDSLKAVAQSMYPWLPIGPFFQHEIDVRASVKASGVPVAIIAGDEDTIIPPDRTKSLRSIVQNLVYDRTIRGAGHNDIYARSEFQAAMREALVAVSG